MMPFAWTAVTGGLAVGAAMSVLYFAGLALGLRRAMTGPHPVAVLVLSAGLRIAGLLGVGWGVATLAGLWAGVGYALAFLAVRSIATALAVPRASARVEGWP